MSRKTNDYQVPSCRFGRNQGFHRGCSRTQTKDKMASVCADIAYIYIYVLWLYRANILPQVIVWVPFNIICIIRSLKDASAYRCQNHLTASIKLALILHSNNMANLVLDPACNERNKFHNI